MAGIVGLQEVEAVYQQVRKTGLTQSLTGISIFIGLLMTLNKILRNYWEFTAESETYDKRKIIGFFTPYIKYVLLVSAMPFLISFIEQLFGEMESLILGKVGKAPTTDGFIEQAQKEQEFLYKELGIGWSLDFGLWMSYLGVIVIRPIMIFIDNYLFSMALCGRYLYLILLEIIAPICIAGLLYEKTEEWFYSWIKNMLCCYLLIPGFMLANFFADSLFKVFFNNGEYGGTELLFIIALKIFLFKQASSKIFQLIR